MSSDASLRDFLETVTAPGNRSDLILEIERLRTQVEQLQRALMSRATIDQAKGIIMAVRHCTAEDAFQALAKTSQHSNVPVKELAAGLVHQASHQG